MIESVPLTLSGNHVAIGPLRQKLGDLYARWDSDFGLSVLRGIDPRPDAEGEEARVFESARAHDAAFFTVYETIYDSKAPRPIGLSAIRHIDLVHLTGELSIFLGERDTWSTGLGTEATRLTLDFAFHALGLSNVALRVRADNARAIVAFGRAGFQPIGRRRGSIRNGQDTHDELWMDVLVNELESPVLRAPPSPTPPTPA